MLLEFPNTYIYWPVPDRFPDEVLAAQYPQDERISYFKIPQYKDRMKEYNRIHPVLEDLLSFNGKTWDWDVLITVRSTQVPMMRILATSPRQKKKVGTKKILLIEDMMVSSKKPTVALSNVEVQDRMTIEAYLAADMTFIPAYHEKKWAIEIAKKHFSPAKVKDMVPKIRECCHLLVPEFSLKTKHKYDGTRKMGVAFVGRLEKIVRLDLMNKLMSYQFILHDERVRPFVCTITEGTTGFDTSVVEVLHLKQKEFWRVAREEMDLAMSFSMDVELSNSKLEPIAFGVPLIIVKNPSSIGMLGGDYPFFVGGEASAYGMISVWRDNYDKMYEKFAKWWTEWFVPTYTHRCTVDSMYNLIVSEATKEMEDEGCLDNLKNNEIVRMINKHAGDEFVLFELIERLGETDLRTLADKIGEDDRETRSLVFSTPWNEFRLALKKFYGYEDASVKVGHLKKIK